MKTTMRSLAFGLACLTALPAAALDLENLSESERAALQAEFRAYLMENPEVIMEAVSLLEERRAEEQAQADLTLVSSHAEELFNDGRSWVGGNPEGDITIVEFMDYRCGYCRKAAPEVEDLIASDGNIRLIVKEFPILGEASLASARFAVATRIVAGADAYKQVHDALIELQTEPSEVTLTRLAEGLALDADAILAEMDSAAVDAELSANHKLARALNINGTPSFVFQDELMRGYLTGPQMEQVVAQKRAD